MIYLIEFTSYIFSMKFTISAPSLTSPTYQTLEEYSTKRFAKVKKFLAKKEDQTNHEVRISVEKVGHLFELTAEIFNSKHVVVKVQNRDIRKAVDNAVDHCMRQLRDQHDKSVRKWKFISRFKNIIARE
jgi:ribosome-associated translation inhibitor RaiA